ATPYRPTGLSTPARTTVRLVDELNWLNSIVIQPGLHRDGVNRAALRAKEAAAAVLDRAADLLDSRGGSSDELDAALTELAAARAKMQEGVTAGLGLAVLASRLTGVQHSFWVVLGALSVLRSNALNTGQDALRAMLGTVAGFIIGAALLVGIGTHTTLLWFLLPLAVFLAGVAP